MISYSKRYIYFVILGKDFRMAKKRQRKWFHFGGSKILRILGIDSLEIHIPKMRKLSNNVTLEIWLQFLQNGKITCTISILSSLVKENNRFVFGFIALVGSIWHWTFCPQHSLHPRSILLCVCRGAPWIRFRISRVEKFPFVLRNVSLPGENYGRAIGFSLG